MKKRLLSALLTFCMVLTLLPVSAFASLGGSSDLLTPPNAYYTFDGEETNAEGADITLSKTAVDKGDGTYDVTLTAKADRVVTAKATEVVFVIDGSGSMNYCTEEDPDHRHYNGNPCEVTGKDYNKSRWKIALNAIETMQENLGEQGVVYKYVVYKSAGYGKHATSYTNFSQLNQITPDGSTYLTSGVNLALDQFSEADTNKVMIVVADGDSDDGYPADEEVTGPFWKPETKPTEFGSFKEDGGEVYTVGFTFSSDEFNDISSGEGYSFTATNAEELNLRMEQISENIKGLISDPLGEDVELVGDVTVTPNSQPTAAVTGSTINWTNAEAGLNGEVTLRYTVQIKDEEVTAGENIIPLNGAATLNYQTDSNGYHEVAFPVPTAKFNAATLKVDYKLEGDTLKTDTDWVKIVDGESTAFDTTIPTVGQQITISGKQYWVAEVTGTPEGALTAQAYNVTVTLSETPVQNPEGTAITIQVIPDGGTAVGGSSVDTYITVAPDQSTPGAGYDADSWNPGTYSDGQVTYSKTFYDCKDIYFTAKTGYVIEAIDADLVFGQSGSDGIYATTAANETRYGEYKADNVQGGSTVTVYVRAAYNVEYYNGTTRLTDDTYTDTAKYVAATTQLTARTTLPTNPSGNDYSHVDCDCDDPSTCEHEGYTDASGGQEKTDYVFVVSLKTAITLPALPEAATGTTVTGWNLGSTTGDSVAAGGTYTPSDAADHADGVGDNIIKFFCSSTANTYDVTIHYQDEKGIQLKEDVTITDQTVGTSYASIVTGNYVTDIPYNGQNYTYDDVANANALNGSVVAGTNTITLVYTLDNWDDADDSTTGGDGIPDKYQAVVKFESKGHGTVTGTTTQVFTLSKDDGNYSTSGTIIPDEVTPVADNGYTFGYWTKNEETTSVSPFEAMSVTGNTTTTFYANFVEEPETDKQIVVVFDNNGGSWANNPDAGQTVNYSVWSYSASAELTAPIVTAPEGKVFSHWTNNWNNETANEGFTFSYNSTDAIVDFTDGANTAYITWTAVFVDEEPEYRTIHVSFEDSDGNALGGGDVISTYPDQKLEIADPTAPAGMTFVGWKAVIGNSPMYEDEFTFSNLSALREEYGQTDWSNNEAWLTFVAVYADEYRVIHVSFVDSDGTTSLGGGDVISNYPDQKLITPDHAYFTPEGKSFVGWKAMVGASPMYNDTFTFNNLNALREEYGQTDWFNNEVWMTFVAVYEETEEPIDYKTINVRFVRMDGDQQIALGGGDVISTAPDNALAAPDSAGFTPEGMKFVGWKVWLGGESMYNGGFTYNALSALPGLPWEGNYSYVTFEAVFEAEEAEYRVIHVNFVDSDETTSLGSGDVISTYPDQELITPDPAYFTPEGKSFVGWKAMVGASPMYDDGAFTFAALSQLVDGNWTEDNESWLTFEAVYTEEKTFTVTFDSNGGSAVASQTVKEGATAVEPTAPTRSGYDFEGWFRNEALTSKYDFSAPVTTDITLYAAWDKQNTGGDGDGDSDAETYAVYYHSNYGSDARKFGGRYEENDKVKVRDNSWWDRDNYRFLGWNTEKDGSGEDYDPDDTFRMPDEDVHLYAQWRRTASDPSDSGTDRWLETQDHRLYMVGYPDDTFGPNRNMTRAEAAQMFYALLLDQNVSYTETFSDVPSDAWYAEAVNTLAALGMIDGYPDGTFRPDATITRAEFCVIALAFAYEPESFDCNFYDVSVNDWFYDYVAQATSYGWISGSNGIFRPNDAITRAEVSVIANNMLGRAADEDYVDRHEDELVTFPDVPRSYWAYYSIMETTNSHDYTKTNGMENWR